MSLQAADLKGPPSAAVASAVAVGDVSGGQETTITSGARIADASFRDALVESLRLAGLLSEGPDAPLSVGATIVQVSAPSFGFDMTTTSVVRYVVRERRSGAVVIDDTITSEHTATMGDAFVGETRARLSVEGSARKSIAAIVQRLNSIQRKGPAPAAASM
jgi:hypothetical protein